ncbi:MAG TPA: phenylalanine--tRNA ligase beta subunit-related protein [Solirubrobacteraceae bacterium]|nr:phenylalanine--tRNA ligase beta subunit-related protein [Solirubrobacteraceae bacterium]
MEGSSEAEGLSDVATSAGWVDADVREEFPELRLVTATLDARPGRSPDGVRQRLRGLSDRFRGSHAVTMRQDPIPWAYRVFYRHVGLDPDADRTPVEAAAVERLLRGGFKSRNVVDDALLVALVETGVPVWALDADRVRGALGIRVAGADERLGRDPGAMPVPPGRLVVADEEGPVAVLFSGPAAGHGVTRDTRRMTLFTIQVANVPAIHVEEALHTCVEVLRSR